jgi:MarR family transcriptional regulator, organic hydroperoxide resistance regulator
MDTNAENQFPQLKLSNQLCFPFYAASMLITRKYQPLLEKLELTYPQYLVLMVLWENNGITVGQISTALWLNTNTLTPLLKRMEKAGLIERKRSTEDERQVLISLTEKGNELKNKAAEIPYKLINGIDYPIENAQLLLHEINRLIAALQQQPDNL